MQFWTNKHSKLGPITAFLEKKTGGPFWVRSFHYYDTFLAKIYRKTKPMMKLIIGIIRRQPCLFLKLCTNVIQIKNLCSTISNDFQKNFTKQKYFFFSFSNLKLTYTVKIKQNAKKRKNSWRMPLYALFIMYKKG